MPDSQKAGTVLVVDDTDSVRNVVISILERANFTVLSANSGEQAIKIAGDTNEKIDLLLSDVEMGNMSGPDLGQTLKKSRPDLHVMIMSGGPSGNLLVLNYGWAFIQKPFVPKKLVQMITSVLHSPDRSQLGGQEFDSRRDIKNANFENSKKAAADIHPLASKRNES
jgi:DNA-binding NtrC family response regulator